VPGVIPITIPVVDTIVATAVLLLLHVPPGEAQVSALVVAGQMLSVPVIGASGVVTETVRITLPMPQLLLTL
jgi:hypothetical protein